MELGGSVYITTNKNKTVLYTGVTSELYSRIWDHKNHVYPKGFTARYNCDVLVYYESYPTISEAIGAEKLIKGGSRKKKEKLINSKNPKWKDLFDEL
jgi:putative endonuclease